MTEKVGDEKEKEFYVPVVVLLALICVASLSAIAGATLNYLDRSWQTLAVKKGHARWVHGADGQAVWEWLPPCSGVKETK